MASGPDACPSICPACPPALPALQDSLNDFMWHLLHKAQKHPDAGPFLAPVSAEDVPDYYTIIIVSCWGGAVTRLGAVRLLIWLLRGRLFRAGAAVVRCTRPARHGAVVGCKPRPPADSRSVSLVPHETC